MAKTLLQSLEDKFAELSATLSGSAKAEHTKAISDFQALVTGLQADVAAKDVTIAAHVATIAGLNTAATASAAEITRLTADALTARNALNAGLAAQGLTADQLPGAETAAPGTAKETAHETYARLSATNPREAGAFYLANAEAVLKSRPKA